MASFCHGYSTSEVCDLTGLWFTDVKYRVEKGIITPSIKRGHERIPHHSWSAADIVALRVEQLLSRDGNDISFRAAFPSWLPKTLQLIQAHQLEDMAGHFLVVEDGRPQILDEDDTRWYVTHLRADVVIIVPLDQCLLVAFDRERAVPC